MKWPEQRYLNVEHKQAFRPETAYRPLSSQILIRLTTNQYDESM